VDYLISIDLEDIRFQIKKGPDFLPANVDALVDEYLDFFNEIDIKVTFFTVGNIVQEYPNLIAKIVHCGHEIACHGNSHTPIDQLTPNSFRDDLNRNIESLVNGGAENISGFRAPNFSVTENEKWIYPVLSELGFTYSSSVLPAKNPLYGWPEFGEDIRYFDGVAEIPITLTNWRKGKIPFGGGVYFRLLPYFLLKYQFDYGKTKPILGYLHPYDIDVNQKWVMHPFINSPITNLLMFYNRGGVFPKLRKIYKGFSPNTTTYSSFVSQLQN
jgi:polysaccharide deacetylase family protein (PEP-CTERM system associated)